MRDKKGWKFLRIRGEILKAVEQVMTETNRNLTGAAAYLIANGFVVYEKEQQMISEMKNNAYKA